MSREGFFEDCLQVMKISKERERLEEEDRFEEKAQQQPLDMEDLNVRVDPDAILNDITWVYDANLDDLKSEEVESQKEREELKKRANKYSRCHSTFAFCRLIYIAQNFEEERRQVRTEKDMCVFKVQ